MSKPNRARCFTTAAICIAALCGLGLTGCSRRHYREHADRDVYNLIAQKSLGTPWEVPKSFSIDPPPDSRLHDPSDPDYPVLPHPGPNLYGYELPIEPTRAEAVPGKAAAADEKAATQVAGLPIQPIPESYWDVLPRQCLARMLEFESVLEEYRSQYEENPPDDLLDPSPRLSLEDILELALLNSRDYQTQKERLYSAALALSLERFDYVPQLSPGGTGGDVDYTHGKVDGATREGMNVNSGIGLEKMLVTGGSLLARFANQVVLTFEGPEGWSKDVSSELVFDFSQSLFQRDIRFNSLIQAERNLVYAARDFARFRKQFFFDIASQYYGLLRNYRNIEIESQNYFSLTRTFEQGQAELRSGVQQNAPNPVEVDQYEQGMLSGRSTLISACNRLEQSLDSLKLQMGLPTEEPINIDLSELERLTLQDESEVASERVRRWLNRVLYRSGQTRPDRAEILNADIYLIERLLEWLRLRSRLGQEVPETASLDELLDRFRVDHGRDEVQRLVVELERAGDAGDRAPRILLYQRTDDLITSLLALVGFQADLAEELERDPAEVESARNRLEQLEQQFEALRERLPEIVADPVREKLEGLLTDAQQLRQSIEELIVTLDQLLELNAEAETAEDALARTLEMTRGLVETARGLLEQGGPGLPPIDIEVDDAMSTALIQRHDLMNERGRLADDLRNVKLAADEPQSVLNFDASHSIQSREDRPTKFSSSDSQTRLSLSFDLPLNRRSQRNDYRSALISYQSGLRSLMALEDLIKFDVRSGLRTIEETRIQYPISVTSAALAAEQVTSTRLQLALGVPNVRGTDLLDALRDSRNALISVANARIGYIVDRAEFVLNLELMELDSSGFWGPIVDSDYQPQPDLVYKENAGPTYGTIPRYLLVSREVRNMLDRPLPGNPIEEQGTDAEGGAEAPEEAADRVSSTEGKENPETPIPYGG